MHLFGPHLVVNIQDLSIPDFSFEFIYSSLHMFVNEDMNEMFLHSDVFGTWLCSGKALGLHLLTLCLMLHSNSQ